MNFLILLSWFYFVFGIVAIVYGIKIENPTFISEGAILIIGALFFEVMVIKDDLNELKNAINNK